MQKTMRAHIYIHLNFKYGFGSLREFKAGAKKSTRIKNLTRGRLRRSGGSGERKYYRREYKSRLRGREKKIVKEKRNI